MTDRFSVLLVDDEVVLVEEIRDFLTWNGFQVITASDGQRALEALAADPSIAVVLTDIRMPFMDGLSLTNRIAKLRSDADAVEVVLMTGHGSVQSAAEAVRAGAFDFLQKPMKLADVLKVVGRAADKAKRRREAYAAREAEMARLKADYAALQARVASGGAPLDLTHESPLELTRILSHELRTPLVPLAALPDLLGDGVALPPGVLHAHLLEVQQSAQRLTDIADDLIELLAPPPADAGIFVAVEAGSVLRQLLANFAPAAARAQVQLVLGEIDAGTVETDEPALVRALGKLVANALAAAEPAHGRVELSATAAPDDEVAFGVRDNGPGMTESQLTTARLPFHQVDMSLTRRVGGMGLGLPLASRAAERLGGRLAITSAPGEGTLASILVPRLRQSKRDS